ncbi:MAG: 16S rRNA (guanine(966)-N(2))-methyltransferase RsmD [Tissierellia bacterium]|nr:16S rRNA (guanine(966)-N(2))-methyltransferase RsmD [Tissierellia bacterium]
MIKYILEQRRDLLRVISGMKKGYRLQAPRGQKTRPTKDRIKESLFNILGNISTESLILDLYAGSGSIGIEFLSRGARQAYFVDKSNPCIKVIKQNLNHTKLESSSKVIKSDSIRAVQLLGKENIKFNYIFMDPPFEQGLVINTLVTILEAGILDESGLIIVEHEKGLSFDGTLGHFKRVDIRNYGNESLSFYTQKQ